jgi:hypothetical protein
MVKLGARVQDVITGFQGIATGRAEYLTGCVQVGITPVVGDDGKPGDTRWFDEPRLEVLEEQKFTPGQFSAAPGGPRDSYPPDSGSRR